jgi:hypothetical protein
MNALPLMIAKTAMQILHHIEHMTLQISAVRVMLDILITVQILIA